MTFAKNTEEELKEMELMEADMLADDLAECYAEIAETDISEKSDDALREIVLSMLMGGRSEEALALLMIIFELADRITEAEKISDLTPEYIVEYGSLIIRRFAELTGITDMGSYWDYDPFEAV